MYQEINPLTGDVTLRGRDGREFRVDRLSLTLYGLREIASQLGIAPSEFEGVRLNVYRSGRIVGSVPALFEPSGIRATNALYSPRPGDFTRREDGGWDAAWNMGPGDLASVPGFSHIPADATEAADAGPAPRDTAFGIEGGCGPVGYYPECTFESSSVRVY